MRSSSAPGHAVDHDLYDGDVVLSFDADDHTYYAATEEEDFGEVVSTTTITDLLDKPALLYWAVNQTIGYLEDHWEAGRAYDEIEIDQMLSEAKKARWSSSGKATKIGSLVHDWIERYIEAKVEGKEVNVLAPGESGPDDPEVFNHPAPHNQKAQASLRTFLRWREEHDIQWVAAEQKVFSRSENFAGTFDAEAIIDGKRTIVDWKTSKGIYDEYELQAAAYVYAAEEENHYTQEDPDRYDQFAILRVPKTGGEFEAKAVSDIEEIKRLVNVFRHLLRVYHWKSNN